MIIKFEKYLKVFLLGTFKFPVAPFIGAYENLSILEITIFTVLGAMTTVITLSFLSEKVRTFFYTRYLKKRKLFTPKTRRRVKFLRNYGLKGVAFLMPVLFGPIIGTMLAATLGESKRKIWSYMFVSSVFWALILSIATYHLSSLTPILNILKK